MVGLVMQIVIGAALVFGANTFTDASPPYSYTMVVGALAGIHILQLVIRGFVGAAPANMIGWGLVLVLVGMDSMNPGMLRATPGDDGSETQVAAPGAPAGAAQSPAAVWGTWSTEQKMDALAEAAKGSPFDMGPHVAGNLATGKGEATVAAVMALVPMTLKGIAQAAAVYGLAVKDADPAVQAAAAKLRKDSLGPRIATLAQVTRALALAPPSEKNPTENLAKWCVATDGISSCTAAGDTFDEVVVNLSSAEAEAAFLTSQKADLIDMRFNKIRFELDGKSTTVELKSLADDDPSGLGL